MTAKTSFYFQSEMWLKGERKEVNAHFAHELTLAGLVEETGETEVATVTEVSPNFATLTSKPARMKREIKPATPRTIPGIVQLETK